MLLRYTLRNPDDIPVLLLLQLEQGVEHTVAELSHKCIQVHLDLLLKEAILNSLIASVSSNILKQWLVFLIIEKKIISMNQVLILNLIRSIPD